MEFHSSWHKGGHKSSTINISPALTYPHRHRLSNIVSFTLLIVFILSNYTRSSQNRAYIVLIVNQQVIDSVILHLLPFPDHQESFDNQHRKANDSCIWLSGENKHCRTNNHHYHPGNDSMSAPNRLIHTAYDHSENPI